MFLHLLISLLATLVIELSIALLLDIKNIKDLGKIAFINCVTNLSANAIVYNLQESFSFYIVFFLIVPIFEILIFLIEGAYFKRLSYNKMNSYLLSLILNGASYGCGLVYTLLIM